MSICHQQLELIVITSFYFAMWIPFFTLNLIWKMMTGRTYSPVAEFATFWLIGANSVVNPFVYMATMTSYQRELFKLARRACGCSIKWPWKKTENHSASAPPVGSDGTISSSL